MRILVSFFLLVTLASCSSLITLESEHPISLKERYLICAHDGMQYFLEEVIPGVAGTFVSEDLPDYQPGEFSEENTEPMISKISLVLIKVISDPELQKELRKDKQGMFRNRVYACTKKYNIRSARSEILADVGRFFWALTEYNDYIEGKDVDFGLARNFSQIKIFIKIYSNSKSFEQYYWNYFEVFADRWIERREWRG